MIGNPEGSCRFCGVIEKKGGGDFSKVATFLTVVKSKDAAITCLICLPLISIVWMFENFYLNLPPLKVTLSLSISFMFLKFWEF